MPKRSPKLPIAKAGPAPNIELSGDDWDRIEAAYGESLPLSVRTAIESSTVAFLAAADFESAAPEVAEAEQQIRAIRSALSASRKAITEPRRNVSPLAAFEAKRMIAEQADLAFVDGNDGLTKFAWTTLLKLEEACNAALADLAEQHQAGGSFLEGVAWKAWIRALIDTMKEHGLPTGVSKDSDPPSPFVAFVAELQGCLPVSRRKSTASPPALAQAISLAKGKIATPASDGTGRDV